MRFYFLRGINKCVFIFFLVRNSEHGKKERNYLDTTLDILLVLDLEAPFDLQLNSMMGCMMVRTTGMNIARHTADHLVVDNFLVHHPIASLEGMR